MNKLIAGSIAGAAGIAILLGGAGSFALWTATDTVNAGQIKAGTLTLDAVGTGVWTNVTNTPTAVIDPATFKIVPGNTLEYSQDLTIVASGDDLSAILTSNGGAITGTITGLTTSLEATSTSPNVTVVGGAITVTDSATPATVHAVLTVAYPVGSTDGQDGTASFTDATFTLSQTTPIIPPTP